MTRLPKSQAAKTPSVIAPASPQPQPVPGTVDRAEPWETAWIDSLVRRSLRDGVALRQQLLDGEKQDAVIAAAAQHLLSVLQAGGKLLLCGNGGSAADCQHLAAELTGRFSKQPRRGLPALALTTDTSALTAIANDFGYEQIFSRQVEALGHQGDVLLCISTSGKSPNVLLAAKQARSQGLSVVALCGPHGGELSELADLCITVPGTTPDRIQELHISVGHILCEVIDRAFVAIPHALPTALPPSRVF
jgi:D-sedoheptulose 7-phosphate isomerase